MIFFLSVAISSLAIVLGMLRVRSIKNVRTYLVILALGAGQIHLALLSMLVYLFAEGGYRLIGGVPAQSFKVASGLLAAILAVTFLSAVSTWMILELVQLVLYILLFFQFRVALRQHKALEDLMRMSAFAGVTVAVFGILLNRAGLTEAPHIFLARGSNEGSVYLLLMGVIPCTFMFLKSRNILYLALILVIVAAQFVATSRSNLAFGLVCFLSIGFFVWRSRWIKVGLSALILGGFVVNFGFFATIWEQQQNYSSLQRINLYFAGIELWQQKPWIGWGWGSTSDLAPQTSWTDLTFPHFHSTYIQFLVELGALGILVIVLWIAGALAMSLNGFYGRLAPELSAYLVLSSLGLIASGFTEAMIFGADRAVQVVVIYAVSLHIIGVAKSKGKSARLARRISRTGRSVHPNKEFPL